MARKLTAEEELTFANVMAQVTGALTPEEERLLRNLDAKRDSEMVPSPELGVWFNLEFPYRVPF